MVDNAAATSKSSRSPGVTMSVPGLKLDSALLTVRAVSVLRCTRLVLASPMLSHSAPMASATSKVRGTLRTLLKGTKPITGNCAVPTKLEKGCTFLISASIDSMKRNLLSIATGIKGSSEVRPLTRIKIVPTLRADAVPPKGRKCMSIRSANASGLFKSALVTKMTCASNACAKAILS